jgi:hypothetical protein
MGLTYWRELESFASSLEDSLNSHGWIVTESTRLEPSEIYADGTFTGPRSWQKWKLDSLWSPKPNDLIGLEFLIVIRDTGKGPFLWGLRVLNGDGSSFDPKMPIVWRPSESKNADNANSLLEFLKALRNLSRTQK